jgi:hypothetical protein
MKTFPALALLILGLAVSVKAQDKQADEAAIRACFANYQAALAINDGQAVAALVSKQTISYYGNILKLILTGDEPTVRKQKPYRKMMVLQVRHDAPNLGVTNATQFFAFVVNKGWSAGAPEGGIKLGKISMDETVAAAPGVVNGVETPAMFFFSREGKAWKVDLVEVVLRLELLMTEQQKNSSIGEDEAIIKALEKRSGMPVSKDIWKPLKAK